MELENMIKSEYQNVCGLVIAQDDKVVHESYYNGYEPSEPVHVASVTKSVFSALVGIAVGKGLIKSLDQRVPDFFPEYTGGDETAKRVTIRDILTMTAPYKYETEPYLDFFKSGNWLNFALEQLGGQGQIGDFLYAGLIGTHILSGILVNATGQSVFDFATEQLFRPLGIHVERSVVLHNEEEHMAFFQAKGVSGWAADEQGLNPAGWGLSLTAMDMAKIGMLYLNDGAWESKQIIPAEWIGESTTEHSRWVAAGLPYGYLWWLPELGGLRTYCAMGDGGNTICCVPEKKLVVGIASSFMPDAKDRLAFIAEHILPVV